ncbi:MAG: tRNA pseudouridine(13) synthase TruD [Anaerolineae bacterium]|nr:tRNA pseudouridine(13) synthase TruD [Anaerolineae bacterium]
MSQPYLTGDLPGVGGQIKAVPADFCVEELPLYEPCGQGQHTYLRIEKEGLSTFQAVRLIARVLNIDAREVGYAGLKDAQAITVQTISVGNVPVDRVARLNVGGIRVLTVNRHTNKLKVGHLWGNRFKIRIRDVPPGALPAAQAIVDVLARRGVPNFFGEQRFGVRGDTHLLGQSLVRGDEEAFVRRYLGMPRPEETPQTRQARQLFEEGEIAAALEAWPLNLVDERRALQTLVKYPGDYRRAAHSVPPKLSKFFASAYQSALFNRLLARRLGSLGQLFEGDLAWIHGKGAVFLVQEPQQEQLRADRLEISPSGPLYGFKVTLAHGEPGAMEQQILDQENLSLEDWRRVKLDGVRRPLRFPLYDPQIAFDDGLVLTFSLPAGCYATVVLDEVMKSESAVALDE